MTNTFTVEWDEVQFEASYEIEPAQHGHCDSMGCPEEPSWPAHVGYIDDYGIPEQFLSDEGKKDIMRQAEKHFEELEKE